MTEVVSIPMYGDVLSFYPNSHRYKFAGKWVPGVTTILGKTLPKTLHYWSANLAVDTIAKAKRELPPADFERLFDALCSEARLKHETTKEEAGDVGHLIHRHARGRLDTQWQAPAADVQQLAEKPQAAMAMGAFDAWLATHKTAPPLSIERIVMSKHFWYCGTCDFFGWVDDRLCVLDFKTGNDVWNEAWYQLGGYELALREELGDGLTGLEIWHVIIHLNKNTGECTPYWRSPSEAELHKTIWRQLVTTHPLLKEMPEMPRAKRKAA